ncbi:phosphoinositide phospholipase C 2-like isoform X4 [Tripterygium wilfordii]|uniref:phosphoinositide phospholipase C 2-like isoform X4 n=1 Tax=Tripterygium wilfordii TaxID=458696 RepID=UPI0018F81A2C|nr:phosphoinositide phospholipase C 2-like isoform X4 [Tripterygium wilfordii]XP_038711778.1 phosphoinositide phospholipase C 2-like isoform X4 [Tripterygium wilfordii]
MELVLCKLGISTVELPYILCMKFKAPVIEPPEDIKELFEKYSENGTMSLDNLLRYLIESQGEQNATKDDAQAIIHSVRHLNIIPRGLHLEAFFRYLLGDINSPLPPPQVCNDMNAPLAHYFLFTGHNSYLTGNQLSSSSSVVPIIKALRRGVRVIELDLWPNSAKNNVLVTHGGTLTSSVKLLKCLRAIKDNAFYASEYPVVITFEDHLTPNLQAKVAKMVNGTFGDMLFVPQSDKLEEFPSPEYLKKKVMISTKPPKEYLETQTREEKETSEKSKKSSKKTNSEIKPETNEKQDQLNEEEHLEEEDEDKTAPEYRHLIAIHAAKVKGAVEDCLTIDPKKARRLSLSEQELEDATKMHGSDIVRFTQQNFLRVYPKGTRISSSNYNPFVAWMHGAQMVAFNMQGYGKYLWIMQGMFRANGGCGYVKKPDFLLYVSPFNAVFDTDMILPVKKILKVKVYMGEGWDLEFGRTHFDLYSPPDFFVKIGIAGAPADKVMNKTKAIEDQWKPVWNEEFEFPLRVPELAILRIEVREYDTSGNHDFGGQTCLPVSELRTGIRAVPLHNRKGDRYKSVRLLMGFEFLLETQ